LRSRRVGFRWFCFCCSESWWFNHVILIHDGWRIQAELNYNLAGPTTVGWSAPEIACLIICWPRVQM
jgi:hypothetical protein